MAPYNSASSGGVESYFDADTIAWLARNDQLNTDDSRNGFSPGEAACFMALDNDAARRAMNRTSLGIVRGLGVAFETKLIKSEAVNLGEGLATAITGAGSSLSLPRDAPASIYCDINGERYRSEEWGMAALRLPAPLCGADYIAPAASWGDVGAASGPLFCALAVRSWARSYAPGPRSLVWAGSEAGLRSAVILERPHTA